jgi:uncharacterized protein YjiS (DUF1127 family)
MSVHTANSQVSFKLPSLSYIDAKWEDPNLHAPARKPGLAGWLSARLAAFRAWRLNRAAAAELAAMSNYELQDIGLTRSDLGRAFDPALNQDLQTRGTNR